MSSIGSYEVAVIGGGIVGASTAHHLATQGVSVILVDKGEVGGLQSRRSWGFIRKQACNVPEVPLAALAGQEWLALSEAIGPQLTYKRGGLVALLNTENQVRVYRDWMEAAGATRAFGTVMLGPDDIHHLVPGLKREWAGGMYTESDGHADPAIAPRIIADHAAALGVTVLARTTVKSIATVGGDVAGLDTTSGRIHADRVVVSAGAWSRVLLRPLGLDVPVRLIRATAGRTQKMVPLTDLAISSPEVGFSQMADGTLVFGSAAWSDYDIVVDTIRYPRLFLPNYFRNRKMIRLHFNSMFFEDLKRRAGGRSGDFDWPRLDHPPANTKKLEFALKALQGLMRGTEDARMEVAWAGTVDVTPDAIPLVGAVRGVGGLFVATAMSSHGFGIGPGVARVVGDLALGRTPPIDLSPFDPHRFDGAKTAAAHHHL